MKFLILFLFATFATIASFAQKPSPDSLSSDTSKVAVYSCPMHPDYISFSAAKCPVCGDSMSKKEVMKAEVMKLYTCSMDNVICTKPGKCPKCGMQMTAYKFKSKSAGN